MRKTVEFKLYPTKAQARTMGEWLRVGCWLYNQALEYRIKAYKRRGQSVTFNTQTAWLTQMRKRMPSLGAMPFEFAKDPLRRVERGMQAFYRRCKAGQKPGYPRFRPRDRFNSLEHQSVYRYVRGDRIHVPNIGSVRFRGNVADLPPTQKILRILRRADGWFAHVLADDGLAAPAKRDVVRTVGVDVGLSNFAALSTGETIAVPEFLRRSQRAVRHAQRRVARRVKRSRNRRKAILRLRRVHERIARQRRNFAHQYSTDLVRRFDLIAVEDLNVKGMVRSSFARSIHDAGWMTFLNQLRYKAEWAGAEVRSVNPAGTSQTCPSCGAVRRKSLSERVHRCECGAAMCRDVAAAQVILARALGVRRAELPVEDEANVVGVSRHQVSPVKREESVPVRG